MRIMGGFAVVSMAGLAGALCLPVVSASADAERTSADFVVPGAQSYVVPAGVCSVTVDVRGAAGGTAPTPLGSLAGTAGAGGAGGRVLATVEVTPGEVLQVNVGERGRLGHGGFGGGGAGDAGGGGASDIRRGGTAVTDRTIVAGGGGGGSVGSFFTYVLPTLPSQLSFPVNGVAGGAAERDGAPGTAASVVTVQVGVTPPPPDPFVPLNTPGGGASVLSGGVGGVSGTAPASSGAPGTVGLGGDATTSPAAPWDGSSTGGGGGGGYFGGGAGAVGGGRFYSWSEGDNFLSISGAVGGSSGGGGSNYAEPAATAVSFGVAAADQNGSVRITQASAQSCSASTTTTTTSTTSTSTSPTFGAPASGPAAAVRTAPVLAG